MSSQNPPHDDDPKPENEETAETPEIADEGDAPRDEVNTDDAVDAEIIEDSDTDIDPADETVMAAASEEEAAEVSDDAGEDVGDDDDGEDNTPEETAASSGGGLAAPFALIISALVVIGVLVVFLNRSHEQTATDENGNAGQFAEAPPASAPIASDPVGRRLAVTDEPEEPEATEEAVAEEPAEQADTEMAEAGEEPQPATPTDEEIDAIADEAMTALAAKDEALTEEPAEATEVAQAEETEAEAEEPGVADEVEETEEDAGSTEEPSEAATAEATEAQTEEPKTEPESEETQESTSDSASTVAAMVSGNNEQDTEDELRERRSELIARAAERNRARREEREETAAALAEETDADTETPDEDETDVAAAEQVAEPAADNAAEPSEDGETGTENNEFPETQVAEATGDTDENAEEPAQTATSTPDHKSINEVSVTTAPIATAPGPDLDELKSDVKKDVLAETEQVIDRKLQATEREVRALRSEITEQQKVSNERLAALTRKIDTMQTDDLSAAKQSTLLLALSDLDDAIEAGTPYSRELENVERIATNARTLATLKTHAATGLPTMSELDASFALSARRALSGAKREQSSGAWSQFWANVAGLFTVRRVGDVPGDTPSAIIARAETRLQSNDLEGAVTELGDLDGSAAEAFSDWVESAKAKIEAKRRIDALERSVASKAG